MSGFNHICRYTGNEAVYTHTFQHEKKEECPVCGNLPTQRDVDPRWTLQDFIENLKEDSNTLHLSHTLTNVLAS